MSSHVTVEKYFAKRWTSSRGIPIAYFFGFWMYVVTEQSWALSKCARDLCFCTGLVSAYLSKAACWKQLPHLQAVCEHNEWLRSSSEELSQGMCLLTLLSVKLWNQCLLIRGMWNTRPHTLCGATKASWMNVHPHYYIFILATLSTYRSDLWLNDRLMYSCSTLAKNKDLIHVKLGRLSDLSTKQSSRSRGWQI